MDKLRQKLLIVIPFVMLIITLSVSYFIGTEVEDSHPGTGGQAMIVCIVAMCFVWVQIYKKVSE